MSIDVRGRRVGIALALSDVMMTKHEEGAIQVRFWGVRGSIASPGLDAPRPRRRGQSREFREDLFYRVRVVEIGLPSLRRRGGDEVKALALHFADMYARRYGRPSPRIEIAALAALRAHAWPGNVRELEHGIESALVLSPSGVITSAELPASRTSPPTASAPSVSQASAPCPASAPSNPQAPSAPSGGHVTLPLGLSLEEASRRYMEATVEASEGNKAEAARRLQIGRNTITRILKGG